MIVILSLDGVCYQDVELAKYPNLCQLSEKGVYTKRLHTVFPSVTWSVHTSVITGVAPGQHEIWGNEVFSRKAQTPLCYYDASKVTISDVRKPTLFSKAAELGKTSAAICWPLTQGSPHIKYNIPECYTQAEINDFSTPALVAELLTAGLEFSRYAAWSSSIEHAVLQDDLTCKITEFLIERKSVDVLFSHFLTHDSFQHCYGTQTPESEWSLLYMDGLVGRIINSLKLAGIFEYSHIIVFSDHGHESVSKFFDFKSFLKQLGIAADVFHTASNGGAFFLYHKKADIPEELLSRMRIALEEQEAIEFVCTKENPEKFGFQPQFNKDTFPDIIVGLNHGWVLDAPSSAINIGSIPVKNPRANKSTHGYLPSSHPRMDSFMIRAGRSFPRGVREETGQICDLYDMVNQVLVNM